MQHQDLRQGFRIDDIVVEPLNNSLTLPDGRTSHLEPKVMEVLSSLARHGNQTVARAEILDTVWDGQIAADELLTRAVSEIRRALGDDPRNPTYIRTIPKRGYRLIGNVRPRIEEPRRSEAQRRMRARFAHAPALTAMTLAGLVFAYVAINGIAIDLPAASGDNRPARAEVARSPMAGRSTPLTSTEGSEWGPALSPDGNYAAFVSSPPGNFKLSDIHVVEVGTAMPVPLTTDAEANNRAPTWSPDGTRIAFARSLDDGRTEIVIKPVLRDLETHLTTVGVFWGHDWSPEGDHLVVAVGEKYERPPRIHLLSVSDGSLVELTNPVSPKGDHEPRFSPDGKTIAFARWNIDGSGAELCLKPLDGSPVNCITPADKKWPIRDFAWSPNGQSLIVSVDGLVRVPVSGAPIEPLPFR